MVSTKGKVGFLAPLLYAAFVLLWFEFSTASASDLFPYKNPGDPIFIVVTGQSNALQVFNSREPMEKNELIWDWARITESGQEGDWHWRIPDPNDDVIYELDPMSIMTGYPQGQRGGIAWGLADTLSKMTGRRVYMVCTAQAGAPIERWKPGEGAVGLELDRHVDAALRKLQEQYPGVRFADIVVWSQGESDAALDTSPEDYAAQWLAWRDNVEGRNSGTPWTHSRHTKWFMTEISRSIPHAVDWRGHEYLLEMTDGRVGYITSDGKETFDKVHFWGDEATKLGNEIVTQLNLP